MKATLTEYIIINGHQPSQRYKCNYEVSTQSDVEQYKAELSHKHNLDDLNKSVDDPRNRYRILFTIKKPKGCAIHT